jgi:hypothetical protein
MLPRSVFICVALATAAEAFSVGTAPTLRRTQATAGRAVARPPSLRMVTSGSVLRRAVRRQLNVWAVTFQVSGEEGKVKLKEFLDEVPKDRILRYVHRACTFVPRLLIGMGALTLP